MACWLPRQGWSTTSVTSAFLIMAIDTGGPLCIVKSVRINMVHAFGIPAGPRRSKYRAFRYFSLGIACRRQLRDLKGTDLPAIKRRIILRIANDTVPKHRHPSTRASAMG